MTALLTSMVTGSCRNSVYLEQYSRRKLLVTSRTLYKKRKLAVLITTLPLLARTCQKPNVKNGMNYLYLCTSRSHGNITT